MAVENLKGSLVGTNVTASPAVNADPAHAGGRVRGLIDKVEVSAAASATSTYSYGYVPTNAVPMGTSRLYYDALSTSGGTVDIGLFGVGDNTSTLTDDDNILANAIAVTSAGDVQIHVDANNIGKKVWELLGATSDPGGVVEVKATLNTACNTGGTLALELQYTID